MGPFVEPMSDDVRSRLGRVLPAGEEVLIRVRADVGPGHDYAEQWLVATDRRVLLVPSEGPDGVVSVRHSEVRDVRMEDLVGGARLDVERRDGPPLRVPFTRSLTPKFAEVAEGLKQLARGAPLSLPAEVDVTRCETCGRLLPEKNGVCAVCIRKWRTFRRILGYMAAYPGRLALMVAGTVLGTVLGLLPPKITQHIIDDTLTPRSGAGLLASLVGLLVAVRVLMWANDIFTRWMSRWLGHHAIQQVRGDLYRQFQLLPVRFYDRRKVGALISRMTNDSDRLEVYMVIDMPFVLSNTLLFVGILALLAATNWKLTLLVLLPIPPIVVSGSLIWGRMVRHWTRWGAKWSRLNAQLNESITGIRVVKAFTQEARESRRFDAHNEDLRDVSVTGERNWFVFFTVTNLLMSFGAFFVWYFGGRQILNGEMTLGALMAFISYLWMMYQPLRWFGDFYNFMLRAFAGAERIFEVLDAPAEPFDAPDARPMPRIEGRMTFRNVAFGYDPGKPVLKGIDLDVRPGEMIGLVGRSGAGKSTLINLICRFYDPDRGVVSVDGVDMREVRLEDLRRQIGMVQQDPFLFDGTIAENIAYARPEADFSDIVRAAKAAEAHAFIVRKTDGYDMLVGERGSRLSGGERQRLSIARAILHDPRILILDEATSSLDTQTERKIQVAIARLVAGRTTFAIAHRLSTLRSASRLVVVDEGKVAEVGTHAELMARQGIFYRLVKTQQRTSSVVEVGGGKGDPAVARP